MRNIHAVALLASLILSSGSASAQTAAIAEQQLANGFLGERNNQLVGHVPAPNATYADEAAAAIERREYRRALDLLKPYRYSGDVAYYYLAGRAHIGLGDFAAARKELATASRKDKNFLGATLSLGMMEAEYGDKAAAARVLEDLKARQAVCAGLCKDAAGLNSSIESIETALKNRKN